MPRLTKRSSATPLAKTSPRKVGKSSSRRATRALLPVQVVIPKRMQESLERARRAAGVLRHIQRNPKWRPERNQSWPVEQQRARAILSKAQATFEAWRREVGWATVDQVIADYDVYSAYVSELVERFG